MTIAATLLCAAVAVAACSPAPRSTAGPASPASPAVPAPPSDATSPEAVEPTGTPPEAPVPPPGATPRPRPTVVDAQPRPSASPTPAGGGGPVTRRSRYAFPVQPAEVASYGREHHDYPATDVFAACGTDVVAPAAGVVEDVSRRDRWDPVVNDGATRGGKSVSIVGDDGVRYYGSHLLRVAPGVRPGARVEPGSPLGRVGRTGSARETPCHLHFGISPPRGPGDWEFRRGVVYPWPYLDSWRADGHRSPARAIRRWSRDNPV